MSCIFKDMSGHSISTLFNIMIYKHKSNMQYNETNDICHYHYSLCDYLEAQVIKITPVNVPINDRNIKLSFYNLIM